MRMVLAVTMSLVSATAFADEPPNFAELPPFCKARLAPASQAEYDTGVAQFGNGNWDHLHHYCYAAGFWNKYRRARTIQEKRSALNDVRTNLEYIDRHTKPDFYMRPKVYLELAEVHRLLDERGQAAKYIERAIDFNPAAAGPHLALVELYRAQGATAPARDAASRGLTYVPDSKALQQAYLELGGKKPFPNPVKAPAAEPEPSKAAATSSAAPAETQNDPATPGQNPPSGAVTTVSGPQGSPSGEERGAVQGCRFCPPDEIQNKWRDSFGDPSKR